MKRNMIKRRRNVAGCGKSKVVKSLRKKRERKYSRNEEYDSNITKLKANSLREKLEPR